MARKKTASKGISRVDCGNTHGWFVRGYRNNKTYSKLFSDKKNGGKTKALQLAREYRDALNSEIQKVEKQRKPRALGIIGRRNKTGVAGICRAIKTSVSGNRIECYTASWRPSPGVTKSTSFSIAKYGEEKAFKLAVAARRKAITPRVGRKKAIELTQH